MFLFLAREHLHTDGTIDQIDFECRRRYRSGCVAAEYLWAFELHPELSDWSRLMTAVEICGCGTFEGSPH